MHLDQMIETIVWQPARIERGAFRAGLVAAHRKEGAAVGCLDEQRAEFGARPDAIEIVELPAWVAGRGEATDEAVDRRAVAAGADAVGAELASGRVVAVVERATRAHHGALSVEFAMPGCEIPPRRELHSVDAPWVGHEREEFELGGVRHEWMWRRRTAANDEARHRKASWMGGGGEGGSARDLRERSVLRGKPRLLPADRHASHWDDGPVTGEGEERVAV